MKKHIVICFLFFAVKLFSQQTDPQQAPPQNISMYNNINMKNVIKAERFKKLKLGGIALIAAGTIGVISGVALVSSGASNQATTTSSYNNSNQPIAPAYASQIAGGVSLAVLGAFAIAGGTVMAAIGNHKEKQYTAASRLSVLVAPTAFRIAYKF